MNQSNKSFIFLFALMQCAPVSAYIGEPALAYGCVRGNTTYLALGSSDDGKVRKLSGGIAMTDPFPRSVESIPEGSDLDAGMVKITDCSTNDFFCYKAKQEYGIDPSWEYVLAVPKVLVVGQTYEVSGAHIIVSPALVSGQNGAPRVQVAILQEINGAQTHIQLTVERGRGVIYWDDFRLSQSESVEGELCVLTSKFGLFNQAEFR